MSNKSMEGKVAIVTGGSSGIGLSTALAFAEKGARVVIADIADEAGQEAVEQIEAAGGEAIFVNADVSKAEAVKALVDKTIEAYGRLDYAVNNAGIGGPAKQTAEYSEDEWNQVIGINLTGVWLCMKYEIEAMLQNGGGAIVNVASILGTVGFATAPAYVAAKHGVVGLSKTAAIEYATEGIRVNSVCPGFIYTPMLENAGMAEGTEAHQQIASLHPMQRMGTPEETANMIVWACSDEASFVTGATLLVDGGYTAR
ncbi:MAG TPA: SDR family oxidoreductase [Candidatus Sulfomarinibacteraceae bacterium]|nr:SDR family oxidoreductase [Candidatus Sulfomarinibacteraceae bacterium]